MATLPQRDLALKMGTPSRLGVYIGERFMGVPYQAFKWILEVERQILEAIFDPRIRIIILNVPPQSGKTTTFGMLLAAWYLGMFPARQVIFIAYNEEYAASWGAKVRDLLQRYGRELFGETVSSVNDSKANWKMANGFGGMLSVGWGGGITGNPGHLILIDDLLKTMEEAASLGTLAKQVNEFDGAIASRLQDAIWAEDGTLVQAGSTIIITATRFSEDDLSGTLKKRSERPDYAGHPVDVISIPAIAEIPDDIELTPEQEAEWTDFLGRHVGEGLKGRFSKGFYDLQRGNLANADGSDGFVWSALYQQNPSSRTGGMFPREFWKFYPSRDAIPPITRTVRAWDLATTAGGGDWTVGSKFGRAQSGDFYLLDRVRVQLSSGEVEKLVMATAKADGFSTKIIIEQEKAGAGKTVVENYRRLLQGYIVEGGKASDGTKEQRATPYSSQQNQGRVWLPEFDKTLCKEWIDEHRKMMGDGRRPRHDDQCLVGSTIVETPEGPLRLDRVRPGDVVLGASGWTRVDAAGLTGWKSVVSIAGLVGTQDHPVWTSRGWSPLANVTSHDVLLTLCLSAPSPTAPSLQLRGVGASSTTPDSGGTETRSPSRRPNGGRSRSTWSSSTASSSGATQPPRARAIVGTTSPTPATSGRASRASTRKSGSPYTEPSRLGTTSITATATTPTTPLPTWRLSHADFTPLNTAPRGVPAAALLSSWPCLSAFARRLPPGIEAMSDERGIGRTPREPVSEVLPVFNLTTEDGTYFANGVLVHNCDTAAYAIKDLLGDGEVRLMSATDLPSPAEDPLLMDLLFSEPVAPGDETELAPCRPGPSRFRQKLWT